jgi:muramoyltetrapeptide carboxypeptidase
MCAQLATQGSLEAYTTFIQAITTAQLSYTIPYHLYNQNGTATGTLVGGNLSILYSLASTNLECNMQSKILFIEDLNEQLYHLDRMMHQLKNSGVLNQIAGLVIGSFTDMLDNKKDPFGKTAYEIIQEHTAQSTYPIAYNFSCGHAPDNRTLILGAPYTLEVNNNFTKLYTQNTNNVIAKK